MENSNKKSNYQRDVIEKYLKYANTEEAFAVLFGKKFLLSYTKQFWAEIVSTQTQKHMKPHKLEFSEVVICLYPKEIRPVYPDKVAFIDSKTILPYETLVSDNEFSKTLEYWENEYITLCRAITWDTSHEDIREQKAKGVEGTTFVIKGQVRKVPVAKKVKLEENTLEKSEKDTEDYLFEISSVKKVK